MQSLVRIANVTVCCAGDAVGIALYNQSLTAYTRRGDETYTAFVRASSFSIAFAASVFARSATGSGAAASILLAVKEAAALAAVPYGLAVCAGVSGLAGVVVAL